MLPNIINNIYFRLISPNKVAEKKGVKFGSNCKFAYTCNFGTEPNFIKIGDNFYSSANVSFITHDGSVNVLRNMYDEYKNIDLFSPIIIMNNVFIGYGVTILPGTKIGNNVIVGTGSVVKGELNCNSVYGGVPAKYICSIDEYIEKNKQYFLPTKKLSPYQKKNFIDKWLIDNYPEFRK